MPSECAVPTTATASISHQYSSASPERVDRCPVKRQMDRFYLYIICASILLLVTAFALGTPGSHVQHLHERGGRRLTALEVRIGPKIVHVVDDNATFRKTIEDHLTQFGFEVVTYPSAQHLLDRLPNDSTPSCILLDVRLPGISGPELQERRLSGLGSTLPIIFVTGFPDIQTTVRTIKAGGRISSSSR